MTNITKWTLIISAIIIVLGGGYWVYTKYRESSSPTVNSSPSATADWQIYSNDAYGYSIKYPNSWFMYTTYSEKDFSQRADQKILVGGDTYWSNDNEWQCDLSNCPENQQVFGLLLFKYDSPKTIEDFVKENINSTGLNFTGIKSNTDYKTANGIAGKKFLQALTQEPGVIGDKINSENIIFQHGGNIYNFVYTRSGGVELDLATQKIFEEMLSTFQFTP